MNMLRRIYSFLSSSAVLFGLSALWVFYYVTKAVWSKEAFATYILELEKNILFQGLYALFLISLLLNIIRKGGRLFTEGRPLAAVLKMILPVGLLLFFAGYLISSAAREQIDDFFIEGMTIQPKWTSGEYYVKKIISNIKDEVAGLSEDDESYLFTYSPEVIIEHGSKDYRVTAFPPTPAKGTFFYILSFGIAPGMKLTQNGKVIEEGVNPLRLLPPGVVDEFKRADLPYKFSLRLAEERVIEKGALRTKIYNLKDPSYYLEIYKGAQKIFDGRVLGSVSFEGYTLEFTAHDYWVRMGVVKDNGNFLIVIGLVLMTAGIPLSIVFALIEGMKNIRHEEDKERGF